MVATNKITGDQWEIRADDWNSQYSTRSRPWGAHWVPSLHSESAYKTFSANRAANKIRREIWKPVSKQSAEARVDWQPALHKGAGPPQARSATWQPISRQGAAESQYRRETWQPVLKEEANSPSATCMETATREPKELQRNADPEPVIDPTFGRLTVDSATPVSDAQIAACDAMALQRNSDSKQTLKEETHCPTSAAQILSEAKELQHNLDLEPLIDLASGGSTEDSASSVSSNASTGEPTNICDAEEERPRMVSDGCDHILIAKLNWADYSSSDEDTLVQTRRLEVSKSLSTASQRTANGKATVDVGFSLFQLQSPNDRFSLYASCCALSREEQTDKRERCCAGKERKKRKKNKMTDLPVRGSALTASLEKHLAEKHVAELLEETDLEDYKILTKGLAEIFRKFQEADDGGEWIESNGATEEEEASLIQPDSDADFYDVICESDKGDCAVVPSSASEPSCCPQTTFFDQISSALISANNLQREILPRRSRSAFLVVVFAAVVAVLQLALVFSDATAPIYPLAVFAWWAFCRAAL